MTVSIIAAQRTGITPAATVVLVAYVNMPISILLAKFSAYMLLRVSLKAGQVGWSLKMKELLTGVIGDGGVVRHDEGTCS